MSLDLRASSLQRQFDFLSLDLRASSLQVGLDFKRQGSLVRENRNNTYFKCVRAKERKRKQLFPAGRANSLQ